MAGRGNLLIPEHPVRVEPRGDFDAATLVLAYPAVYDDEGKPRPWILLDARGNPRVDVVYDQGKARDLAGHALDAQGQRIGREP